MEWNLFWTGFGAVGTMLGAVGTSAATGIALYQIFKNRQRLDCAFLWAPATKDEPVLIINNIGALTATLDTIDIEYGHKYIGQISVLQESQYHEQAVVAPGQSVRIVLSPDKFNIDFSDNDMYVNHDFEVVVRTTTGLKYVIHNRFAKCEMMELISGCGLNKDIKGQAAV